MNTWLRLLNKDLRFMRPYAIGVFVLQVAIFVLAFAFSIRHENPNILAIIMGAIVILFVFYYMVMLLASVELELKQWHLWLHNPQPMGKLLSSKMAAVFVYFIVSFTIALLMFAFSLSRTGELGLIVDLPYITMVIVLFVLHIILGAVYMGVLILTIWAISQMMHAWVGKWSRVVYIGGIILLLVIIPRFTESSVYAVLTQWLPIHFDHVEMWTFGEASSMVSFHLPNELFVGEYVFHAVIAAICLLGSAWILDRKVEV